MTQLKVRVPISASISRALNPSVSHCSIRLRNAPSRIHNPRSSLMLIGLLGAAIFIAMTESSLAQSKEEIVQPQQCLRVGFGKSDITPLRPTPMAGYYGVRYSTDTHDPLWSKATLLDDGTTKVVLIAIDLIATTPWMVAETRELIREKLGIPAECVMISATHSHTGPMLYEPEERQPGRFGNQTDEAKQYMLALPSRILESVIAAESSMVPASLHHGIGNEPKLAFNRRFFMTDGTVGWNPGKLNPKIVREAGPTDDALPMIIAQDEKSTTLGVLSSFAIHLDTVGGTEWSADMPFTMEQCLGRAFGIDRHYQYATGCCGDVNHIDVRSASRQGGHYEAARIGTRLSGAVLRNLNSLQRAASTGIRASREMVMLPKAPHTEERSRWAKEVLAKISNTPAPPFMDMVEAYRIADVEARGESSIEAEVQVISVGREIAWVALPGEIFVQLGMAIKTGSP
ncbi:MAG: hypothetical protein FJ308_21025, partial [Planctomycetes bacterium]|nr:hypothetical protein [Planctomycetota bacterium]